MVDPAQSGRRVFAMLISGPMKRSLERNMRVSAGAALALGLISLFVAVPADARDDRLRLPILDAMSTPDAKAKLNGGVRFYFGPQAHPAPTRSMGDFTANKKTNFTNKSDKEGCEWAFLSAAISLQERAGSSVATRSSTSAARTRTSSSRARRSTSAAPAPSSAASPCVAKSRSCPDRPRRGELHDDESSLRGQAGPEEPRRYASRACPCASCCSRPR